MDNHKTKWDKLNDCGKRWNLGQESEDFASWAIIKYLEGSRQTFYQIYVDYRRKHHGDDRSLCGIARKNERCYYESIDKISNAAIYNNDPGRIEGIRKNNLIDIINSSLPVEEQIIIELHISEMNMEEIGLIMGVGQSRISQRIKSILKKVKYEIKQIT